MTDIVIMGDEAKAHKHDGSLESVNAVKAVGILCDGVLDRLSGKWWIVFLSPRRGAHQAAPGDIIVRFPSNDFFAISEETFHEVATVKNADAPKAKRSVSKRPDRKAVPARRKRS